MPFCGSLMVVFTSLADSAQVHMNRAWDHLFEQIWAPPSNTSVQTDQIKLDFRVQVIHAQVPNVKLSLVNQ